jgi:hypothetical protein
MRRFPPERIVCLIEETVEALMFLARRSAQPARRAPGAGVQGEAARRGLHPAAAWRDEVA